MKINEWFGTGRNKGYVYIIAEVAQNHDGSLGQAHAFIDACSTTGVDAIKFQTHIAEAESTLQEPFRVKFSYEDNTRYDYWKRMEFTEEQWKGMYEHANDVGLEFLSSPFSLEAFELLDRIGVRAWKLGSGEVYNKLLIEKMISTKKPILFSSGLSTYSEIDKQILDISRTNIPYALFQCTTAYPTKADQIGLNVIQEMLERYSCPIGLSDHSGTIYPSLAAVVKGALLIEEHVTLSKYMFGPDVKASLDIEELSELVRGIRFITESIKSPIDKNVETSDMKKLKNMFAKGIYAKTDIVEGEKIAIESLSFKKPLQFINSNEYSLVINAVAKRTIYKGEAIKKEDLKVKD